MDEHSLLLCRSLTDPREISYNFVFGPPGTSLPARLVAIPKDNRNYSGLLAACGGSLNTNDTGLIYYIQARYGSPVSAVTESHDFVDIVRKTAHIPFRAFE